MKIYNTMWLAHNDSLDVEVRDPEMPLDTLYIIKPKDLDPKLYVLDYGKCKGMNLVQIYSEDPDYIDWLKQTSERLLLTQCLDNL